MLKAKLFFTRTGREDDIIQVFDDDEYLEMVRVVYTPGEYTKASNEFYFTRRDAMAYLSSILKSMEADSDPFEFVELQTAIHPSVMYPIGELEDARTRWLIEDMIEQAIRANVFGISLKRNVRTAPVSSS